VPIAQRARRLPSWNQPAVAAPSPAAARREGPQLTSTPGLEALVERAQEGDSAAFADLYQARSHTIQRYVGAIVRDPDQTEDAVAETFLLAWRDLPKLRKVERFDAWLLRIAHNRAINEVRRRRTVPIEEIAEPADPNPRVAPDERAEQRWESERLRRELLELSEAHREVLVLRFLHELSHAEIARQLGKREDAVRALQYRALRQLRLRYGASE
jgi:RNA polymerase sigma-70 factor (ECF subfamily)